MLNPKYMYMFFAPARDDGGERLPEEATDNTFKPKSRHEILLAKIAGNNEVPDITPKTREEISLAQFIQGDDTVSHSGDEGVGKLE